MVDQGLTNNIFAIMNTVSNKIIVAKHRFHYFEGQVWCQCNTRYKGIISSITSNIKLPVDKVSDARIVVGTSINSIVYVLVMGRQSLLFSRNIVTRRVCTPPSNICS